MAEAAQARVLAQSSGLREFWQPHTQTGAGAPTCQPPHTSPGWKHQRSQARSHQQLQACSGQAGMVSCVGNGPHSHRHPRGSATAPGREGRSWEALPEERHDQSQPPGGCPGAGHTSSAPGAVPALPGWAGLCCPHPLQRPGSASCTHRPRESRHPELLSAPHTFLYHSCCLQP